MKCEYCEAKSDEVAIGIYAVDDSLRLSCTGCLDENIPRDNRQPHLNIVEDEIVKGNEAFHIARKTMAAHVDDKNMGITAGYIYDLATFFKRIVGFHEAWQSSEEKLRERLGFTDLDVDRYISGAYCPACRAPLLITTMIKINHSISVAASKLAKMMEESRVERNPIAYICLGCQTAYCEEVGE